VAARRGLTPTLLVIVLVLAAAPAAGLDFDFSPGSRVTFGVTNADPAGGQCAAGSLQFARPTVVAGTGTVTTIVRGRDISCFGIDYEIAGGKLVFSDSGSVKGTIGHDAAHQETIFGQVLSTGHGFVAVDSLGLNTSIPQGFGLTVFIESTETTFAQDDLTGNWRVVAMTADQYPGTATESISGSIVFDPDGGVTGAFASFGLNAETIIAGNVTVSSDGQIGGFVETTDGETTRSTLVPVIIMAPDKRFVAGLTISEDGTARKQGMFFLQREPAKTTYAPSELAGTWNIFRLVGGADDSSGGGWVKGTITFNGSGQIVASKLVDDAGRTLTPLEQLGVGTFHLAADGLIDGAVDFRAGEDDTHHPFLRIQATMFEDKRQIIGVDHFTVDETTATAAFGLFAMIKAGSPPIVQFHAPKLTVTEGGTAVVQVDRSGDLSVEVVVNYSATPVTGDFSAVSGTVTIPAGGTTGTFSIVAPQNTLADGDKIVNLTLTGGTNGAKIGPRSTAQLRILDDDPVVELAKPAFSVREGTPGVITVVRKGAFGSLATVGYNVSGITAVPGVDFTPVQGPLVFGPNDRVKTFSVPTLHNGKAISNRTVLVTLSVPTVATDAALATGIRSQSTTVLGGQATAVLTIVDEDAVLVQFSGRFVNRLPEVVLSKPARTTISVPYFAAESGTATLGVDFVLTDKTQTLVFRPGVTSQTIPVKIVDDNIAEGTETFTLVLSEPTFPGKLGSSSSKTFGIRDNDFGGTVRFANANVAVGPGDTVGITLLRSGGLATTLTVRLTIGGTAEPGVDFSLPDGDAVTFAPHVSAQTLSVAVGANVSAGATIVLGFSFPVGAAASGNPKTSTVTVVKPATIGLSAAPTSAAVRSVSAVSSGRAPGIAAEPRASIAAESGAVSDVTLGREFADLLPPRPASLSRRAEVRIALDADEG
jgi:Calx-beta domain